MNNYEAMFLVNAKLVAKDSKGIFDQIQEAITKNEGEIVSSRIWAEKKKLSFPIKKHQEATYYLVNFRLKPGLMDKVKEAYRLNENILRVLILRSDEEKPQPSKQETYSRKT